MSEKIHRRSLSILYFITFFDHLAVNITFPVVTFVFFDLRSQLFIPTASHALRSYWYGIVNALPQFIALIMVPIFCWLSDSVGRKLMFLLTAMGVVSSSACFALGIINGNIIIFMLGSIFSGLFTRTEPIALATVGDLSRQDKRIIYMSRLQFFIAIGAFVGPLIGACFIDRYYFRVFNFSLPYILALLVGVFTLFFTLFLFYDKLKQHEMRPVNFLTQIGKLLNKQVIVLMFILLISQLSWRTYYQFILPILRVHFNYQAGTLGIFASCIALWIIIGAAMIGYFFRDFLSSKVWLVSGLFVMLVGNVIAILSIWIHSVFLSQGVLWFSAVFMAGGDVIAYSAIISLMSNQVSLNHQGKMMALVFMVYTLAWGISALLGGCLASFNIVYPLYFAFFVLLILLTGGMKFIYWVGDATCNVVEI